MGPAGYKRESKHYVWQGPCCAICLKGIAIVIGYHRFCEERIEEGPLDVVHDGAAV
jgi:hypothetical protein